MLSTKAIIARLEQSKSELPPQIYLNRVDKIETRFASEEIEVLIVDDSPTVWKMVEYLKPPQIPYRITLATDGFAAVLEVVKRVLINPKQLPFHIIFMDQQMPRLTGDKAIIDMAWHLNRAGFDLKDIPIISISSIEFTPQQLEAMRIVDRIPEKKITAKNITHMVEKHVFKNSLETSSDKEVSPVVITRMKSVSFAVRKMSLTSRLPRHHSSEHVAVKAPPSLRMPHCA